MSVTSLLKLPDVRAHLARLAPLHRSRITAPLLAPPVTHSYALIGTAFDYAVRFELQRQYSHVRTERWVAQAALQALPKYSEDPKALKVAQCIVADAKTFIGEYSSLKRPSPARRKAMATHAIRLAKVDPIFRAGYVDKNMSIAEPGNVADVLRLLDIVPWKDLVHESILWLNPTFGRYSEVVGGADCDIVSGGRLIDIKVTKNDGIQLDYILQLISYALLARGARNDSPDWPAIDQVGVYFARHAHLWAIPVHAIYQHPEFQRVATWYFKRAEQEFGPTLPVDAPLKRRPGNATGRAKAKTQSRTPGKTRRSK